jgi:hypothetical protein
MMISDREAAAVAAYLDGPTIEATVTAVVVAVP